MRIWVFRAILSSNVESTCSGTRPQRRKVGRVYLGGDVMLTLAVLLVIGVIALFVAFSIVGLITPKPDDQDIAASGVVQRQ